VDRSRVTIVIPALNESATIKSVVVEVSRYGVPIVVDDGSTDNTSSLAIKAGAVVVTHDRNLGYDEALNSGFKKSAELGSEIIITIDADGQHDPSLIQKFIDAVDAGADVAAGIRNRRSRIAEQLFALYTKIYFGINDPLCGMKAYRTEVYQRLGYFDSYGSIGTELIIFSAKNGYKITDIPFKVLERKGQSRFGQKFLGNYKIFRALLLMNLSKNIINCYLKKIGRFQ